MAIWRINRGNSQRKGPKAGVYLEGFKIAKRSVWLEKNEQECKKIINRIIRFVCSRKIVMVHYPPISTWILSFYTKYIVGLLQMLIECFLGK